MTDTFTTPDGTYGGKMKPNALFKWVMGRQAKSLAAKPLKTKGIGQLVLVTTGRKSGTEYRTPVAYFPEADGSWLICASAGGAQRHPAWYRNLAASGSARIAAGGELIPVAAAELHGEERTAVWAATFGTQKGFVGYTSKTDRELPIIRLTRA